MRHPIAKALSLAQVAAREDEIADLSALSSVQGPEEGIGTIGGIGLSSYASDQASGADLFRTSTAFCCPSTMARINARKNDHLVSSSSSTGGIVEKDSIVMTVSLRRALNSMSPPTAESGHPCMRHLTSGISDSNPLPPLAPPQVPQGS